MCIACELGYWAMIDALEAERDAAKNNIAADDPLFACEPAGERAEAEPVRPAQQAVDEPTP
jgi:hypothetical protein